MTNSGEASTAASVRRCGLIPLLSLALCGLSVAAAEERVPDRVTIDRVLHVPGVNGADVVLNPGEYRVAAHETTALTLTAIVGGASTTLPAVVGSHAQQIHTAAPVAVRTDEDTVHIVLLLPDGTTLDTAGTYSGIRGRGAGMAPVGAPMLGAAMQAPPVRGTAPMLVQGGGPTLSPTMTPVEPQVVPTPQQLPPNLATQPGLQRPVPLKMETGPQLSPCKADLNRIDIGLAATTEGPFTVLLTWNGPLGQYRVSGPVTDFVNEPSSVELAAPVTTTVQAQSGRTMSNVPPSTGAGTATFTYLHDRLVPNSQYSYSVETRLPDGKLACGEASTKTAPPPPVTALPSSIVNPNDVRLGFVRPPYSTLIVTQTNFSDGAAAPAAKALDIGPVANPLNRELRYELLPKIDARLSVKPGFPPLPTVPYEFVVRAVWSDGKRMADSAANIRIDGLPPLKGWADLHTHPMSNLAFGGKVFHGGIDVGSLLPAVHVPKPVDAKFACPPGEKNCDQFGIRLDPDQRPLCRFDSPARSMEEALGEDLPTHGGNLQSRCGNENRKVLISAMSKGRERAGLGAPSFEAWPRWDDIGHTKMWVDWIRRAYDGGQRVMVALSHNNRTLGDVALENSCKDAPITCVTDDVRSSDLQIQEIKRFVARHSDFMQIARTPAELYGIVAGDPARNVKSKMAIVLGVEIDNIGNFNLNRTTFPSPDEISREIQRLYDQDVRYIFPVHVTDNVFGGTALYNVRFNWANYRESLPPSPLSPVPPAPGPGNFWHVVCAEPGEEIGWKAEIGTKDSIAEWFPASQRATKLGIPADKYPPRSPTDCAAGHRNAKGLRVVGAPLFTPPYQIGKRALTEMMRRGMIIDVDHMSHLTVEQTLAFAEGVSGGGYPLVSGHDSVRNQHVEHANTEHARLPAQLWRISCLGGMFGLETERSEAFDWAAQYDQALSIMSDPFAPQGDPKLPPPGSCQNRVTFGPGSVAIGSDAGSLVEMPRPPNWVDPENPTKPPRPTQLYDAARNPMFPTTPSRTGTKTWNYDVDGVAHYGMFADFLKDVATAPMNTNIGMKMNGEQLINQHAMWNADYFWRMWLKIEQQSKKFQ